MGRENLKGIGGHGQSWAGEFMEEEGEGKNKGFFLLCEMFLYSTYLLTLKVNTTPYYY